MGSVQFANLTGFKVFKLHKQYMVQDNKHIVQNM